MNVLKKQSGISLSQITLYNCNAKIACKKIYSFLQRHGNKTEVKSQILVKHNYSLANYKNIESGNKE